MWIRVGNGRREWEKSLWMKDEYEEKKWIWMKGVLTRDMDEGCGKRWMKGGYGIRREGMGRRHEDNGRTWKEGV